MEIYSNALLSFLCLVLSTRRLSIQYV